MQQISLDFCCKRSVFRGMRNAPQKSAQPVSAEAVAIRISQLEELPLAAMRAAWRAEFRKEPPKGLWRSLLLMMLAWRIQERTFGGHDKNTLQLLKSLAQGKERDQIYQKLKAGTVIVREFEGVRHAVTVTPGGYVWQDRNWSSLSAIARQITGTNWNGPRFFGLRQAGRAWQNPNARITKPGNHALSEKQGSGTFD